MAEPGTATATDEGSAFQMWPQTPLVMMSLGLVLLVLATFAAGDAPAKFPMTSKYITYVFAGVLVLAGMFMLVVRRYGTDDNSWTKVLEEALGSWSAMLDTEGGFMTNLFELGMWVLLIIATIFATVFVTSIVNPSDPLAWVGYAVIAALFIMVIITSPIMKAKFAETTKLALGYLSRPRILGFLAIAVVVLGVLALSAAYPVVSYLVYALAIGLVLYFGRDVLSGTWDVARRFFRGSKGTTEGEESGEGTGTKKPEKGSGSKRSANKRSWLQTLTRLARNWLADTLGWLAMDQQEYLEYEKALNIDARTLDARRAQLLKDYGFAAATVGTSGLIVTLAVLLPFIYRRLPSLHIEHGLGHKYFTTPKPLSAVESMPLAKVLTGDRPTAEYTISWWQFINSRKAEPDAVPMIDLGSVGQVFLGPQTAQQTIALKSPLTDTESTRIAYKIKFQRWQNVAIRGSGNTVDVFVDGKLVASAASPPPAIRKNMDFGLPGLPLRLTEGGIAGFAVSPRAEPYLGILWNSLTDSPHRA